MKVSQRELLSHFRQSRYRCCKGVFSSENRYRSPASATNAGVGARSSVATMPPRSSPHHPPPLVTATRSRPNESRPRMRFRFVNVGPHFNRQLKTGRQIKRACSARRRPKPLPPSLEFLKESRTCLFFRWGLNFNPCLKYAHIPGCQVQRLKEGAEHTEVCCLHNH